MNEKKSESNEELKEKLKKDILELQDKIKKANEALEKSNQKLKKLKNTYESLKLLLDIATEENEVFKKTFEKLTVDISNLQNNIKQENENISTMESQLYDTIEKRYEIEIKIEEARNVELKKTNQKDYLKFSDVTLTYLRSALIQLACVITIIKLQTEISMLQENAKENKENFAKIKKNEECIEQQYQYIYTLLKGCYWSKDVDFTVPRDVIKVTNIHNKTPGTYLLSGIFKGCNNDNKDFATDKDFSTEKYQVNDFIK